MVTAGHDVPGRLRRAAALLASWTPMLRSRVARLAFNSATLALLVAIPWIVGTNIDQFSIGLALVILLLSLGLLVRTAGQSALCQVSFAAVGAAAFSDFSVKLGLPWVVAFLMSGLVAIPIGAMLAIPAVRLSRLMLAIATFGFGIVMSELFYPLSIMFGVTLTGIQTPRPVLSWLSLSSDRGFYYLVLVIAVVIAIGVRALVRGRLGRLLTGYSDAPVAMAAHGVSSIVLLVTTFCISAFIAGLAGSLDAMSIGSTTSASFDPYDSLTYFTLILIVIGMTPIYAFVAAAGPTLVMVYVQSASGPHYLQLLFGVSAIITALVLRSRQAQGQIAIFAEFRDLDRDRRGVGGVPAVRFDAGRPDQPQPGARRQAGRSLTVDAVSVKFGGVVALSEVSLRASAGMITGLIGPNGAGKTTLFNVCSGLIVPAAGKVYLDETIDLSGMSMPKRANLGVGRTFQSPRLFESLNVRQNIALGCEAGLAGRSVLGQIWGAGAGSSRVVESTERAIELCQLQEIADRPVATLSAGRRRLVELGRCLASGFGILLLDEPSAGLDRSETMAFADIVTSVVRTTGLSVLLVEHDMDLVMGVCEHVYVLDFGRSLFEGTPAQVLASETVRRVYLGELDDVPTA